ncbi:hypothetical protein POM88_045745 [Heracleum sosnowskyi]|uniref:BED-type domain-containing protein n=1 Tax=Heracleum sosnowskyi TaxID=360622 RepID=A0AAD8H7G3_9APIA|nr:hypothetical protein POM88_045745 [Heracleum sosnowskyi]
MAEEHLESNIPIYESLSEEDEADIRENENANTKPSTEGSVKPVKEEKPQKAKGQGTKRKWSKVCDTFAYIKGTSEEGDTTKCQKCGYTIPYNSSFGTGNLLKHQKTCTRSSDIRQMIISSIGGSIAMHSAKFDPMVFRDMITDAVVRHNLPLQFVEYEGIREAFKYAHPKAVLVSRNTLRSDILLSYKSEKRKLLDMLKNVSAIEV